MSKLRTVLILVGAAVIAKTIQSALSFELKPEFRFFETNLPSPDSSAPSHVMKDTTWVAPCEVCGESAIWSYVSGTATGLCPC